MNRAFQLIHSDYDRYYISGEGKTHPLAIILLTQGLWASAVYRLAHSIRTFRYKSVLYRFLDIVFTFFQKGIEIISSISLSADCKIGSGLYVGHFGPIILNGKTEIGNNCNLSQGVTIGVVQRGERQGVPKIQDRVYIGPNAIVIGGIDIGHDAAIGAGAVVTRSVPPLAVVAGNPAKIISYEGSFEMVRYEGMEKDPDRIAALEIRMHAKNEADQVDIG